MVEPIEATGVKNKEGERRKFTLKFNKKKNSRKSDAA